MSVDFEYDPATNTVRTSMSGTLKTTELIEYAEKVLEENIEPGFIDIVDMNKVEDLVIQYSTIVKLQQVFDLWSRKKHHISIFYTPNDTSSEITGFMLPLFRKVGLTVHVCKTGKQIAELQKIVKAKRS